MRPIQKLTEPGNRNDYLESIRRRVVANELVAGDGIRISPRGNHTLIEAVARAKSGGPSEPTDIALFIIRGFSTAVGDISADRVSWDDPNSVEESDQAVSIYCGPPNGIWTPRGTNQNIATLRSYIYEGYDDFLVTTDNIVWTETGPYDVLETYPYFRKVPVGEESLDPKAYLICWKQGERWIDLNVIGRCYELPYRRVQMCINGEYRDVVLRISRDNPTGHGQQA